MSLSRLRPNDAKPRSYSNAPPLPVNGPAVACANVQSKSAVKGCARSASVVAVPYGKPPAVPESEVGNGSELSNGCKGALPYCWRL
jgi:hypothetical protein